MIELVSATIIALCNINTIDDFEKHSSCIDYYNNCIIQSDGSWTDKDIINCIREKDGTKKRKSIKTQVGNRRSSKNTEDLYFY